MRRAIENRCHRGHAHELAFENRGNVGLATGFASEPRHGAVAGPPRLSTRWRDNRTRFHLSPCEVVTPELDLDLVRRQVALEEFAVRSALDDAVMRRED